MEMDFKRWLDDFCHPVTFQRVTNNKGVHDFESVYANRAFRDVFSHAADDLKALFSKSTYAVKSLNRDLLAMKTMDERMVRMFEYQPSGHHYQLEIFSAYDDVVLFLFKEVTSQILNDRNIDVLFTYQTEMFWVIRPDGTILRVNDAVTETLGYDLSEMEDHPLDRFIHPDDLEDTREAIERLSNGETVDTFTNRCRHQNGTYHVFDWKAGRHHGMIFASARDVTNRAEREQRLYDEASRDSLTGLYNRRYFYEKLDAAAGGSMTLAIIDLDHFKLVNDMWGHPTGDRVLTSLAKELTKHAGDGTLVSRIGGEEFALLFREGLDDVRSKLRALKDTVARARFPVVKHVTVSIGFAQKQEDESVRGWFKRADDAMYVAKEQGRNTVVEATTDIPILTSKYSEWDPSWSSGNMTIDRQHKHLLFLGKQLVYTTYPDKTRGHVEEEVRQIIREVRQHFETEERLLEKAGYPALGEHKSIHFDLLQKALHIQTLFETGKIDAMTVFSFLIEDFIMNHLLREDIKYFDYIPKEDTTA